MLGPVHKTSDAPDGKEQDSPELRSRTDARKERLAREDGLMSLSETLVSSSDAVLGKLELSEALTDAITSARRVRTGSARNRALRQVRSTLRDEDFEAIRRKLGAVHGK